jgi:hypothetical protein
MSLRLPLEFPWSILPDTLQKQIKQNERDTMILALI